MTSACEHICHTAGLALCIECQDHPAHHDQEKFEFDPETEVTTVFVDDAPEEEKP